MINIRSMYIMKNNKSIYDLNDQMEKDLREAKTKEELDELASSAGFELSDDDLDNATGGTFDLPVFRCIDLCG